MGLGKLSKYAYSGCMQDDTLSEDEKIALGKILFTLRTQHRHFDEEITALREMGAVDMLKIRRMKKVKLTLKDKIARIEDALMPDIIA